MQAIVAEVGLSELKEQKMYSKFAKKYSDLCAVLMLLLLFFGGFGIGLHFENEAKRAAMVTEQKAESYAAPVVTTTALEVSQPQYISLGEFRLTGYCACEKCCGYWATVRPIDENGQAIVYTASGTVAQEGRTVAVDPDVIPFGTKLLINGVEYIAEDCGGAVTGNSIDIYFNSHKAAEQFAVQYAEVFILKE